MGLLRKLFGTGLGPAARTPEAAAEQVANAVGAAFSLAHFVQLFSGAQAAEGWTADDALAAWYSLGNLALVVSTWTVYNDRARAPRIIARARAVLQRRWELTDDLFGRMRAAIDETEASALRAFMSCKEGADLSRFFARYVSRILGAPVPFSQRTVFEDEMAGIIYMGDDPILHAAVCRTFVDVCSSAREVLERTPVDWEPASAG